MHELHACWLLQAGDVCEVCSAEGRKGQAITPCLDECLQVMQV
jgi:hypothetical protein